MGHYCRYCHYCNYCNYCDRLLDLFRTAFPYRNKLEQLIMDIENVHYIKYYHVDGTNHANPTRRRGTHDCDVLERDTGLFSFRWKVDYMSILYAYCVQLFYSPTVRNTTMSTTIQDCQRAVAGSPENLP